MSSPQQAHTTLDGALRRLGETVREWRVSGRRTTTAGITSSLIAADAFDLEALGLASREEFWRAAENAGVVIRERLSNGHWYLLLPGESVPEDVLSPRKSVGAPDRTTPKGAATSTAAPPSPAQGPFSAGALVLRRLRTDVWNAFVDWEGAYRRFWDRTHLRAFLIPAEWAPHNGESDRFAEIKPASFAVQVGWMRDFARRQPDDSRMALESSLADGAPRGAFRRELEARGLVRQWREVHRAYVAAVVAAWAAAEHVEVGQLFDPRASRTEVDVPKSQPAVAMAGPGASGRAPDTARDAVRNTESDTSRLRQRVHEAIDAMSIDELASLPIRASHLLQY